MTSGRRRWRDLQPAENSGLLTALVIARRPIAAARHNLARYWPAAS